MKAKYLLMITMAAIMAGALQAQDIGAGHIHLKGTSTPTGFTSGTQAKFLWYPAKYAFRAGEWSWSGDPQSGFGNYSLAFGLKASATNAHSFAFGATNEEYEDEYPLLAAGTFSVAIGSGAYAGGTRSFSMGTVSYATGAHSFAFGSGWYDDEEELEYYGVKASGANSFAFGYYSRAWGTASIAFGYQNTANNAYSSAIGGYYNIASGNYAAALGGQYNRPNGTGSITLGGYWNISNGSHSLTAGYRNTASYAYSAAFGWFSESKAESSFAAGRYLISRSRDAFVVGAYNAAISTVDDDTSATRPLFIVGNGTGTSEELRMNAFVVRANGEVEIYKILPRGGISMGNFD